MSKYLKEEFKNFQSYTPGEQPKDMEYIKLNTNESPFPPGDKVLKAIKSEDLEKLRLYPSPEQNALKSAIGKKYGLECKNVFVSNGSDDIINFAFMAFSGGDIPVVYPDISYGFYSVLSGLHGIKALEIPLMDDFSINAEDYIFDSKQRLIVIANPNAPTGLSLSLEDIEKIVKSNNESVVLIDEAYVEFGGETAIPLVSKYDNLIVSRTYSKSASLAGARLGYAVGSQELIEDLEMIKYSTNPYNINRMTELVGLAVLDEEEYYKSNCAKIQETRKWVMDEFIRLGFGPLESKTNFIFLGTGKWAKKDSLWENLSGKELYERLKEKGILVRWFNKDRIRDFVRITIGSDDDMKKLISVLERNF